MDERSAGKGERLASEYTRERVENGWRPMPSSYGLPPNAHRQWHRPYVHSFVESYTKSGRCGNIWNPDGSLRNNCTISRDGIVSLHLSYNVRVDISPSGALRIHSYDGNVVLALSTTGNSSALVHPNGKVYQDGNNIEVVAFGPKRNNRHAKMWFKGVSFTTDDSERTFVVDSQGTRISTDIFCDLSQDYPAIVFDGGCHNRRSDCEYTTRYMSDAFSQLKKSNYRVSKENTETWIFSNIRISETFDGIVRVDRNAEKYFMRTGSLTGSVMIETPFMHCSASLGQCCYLFVRHGNQRIHYNGADLIVRNGGHASNFINNHLVKVYENIPPSFSDNCHEHLCFL